MIFEALSNLHKNQTLLSSVVVSKVFLFRNSCRLKKLLWCMCQEKAALGRSDYTTYILLACIWRGEVSFPTKQTKDKQKTNFENNT